METHCSEAEVTCEGTQTERAGLACHTEPQREHQALIS